MPRKRRSEPAAPLNLGLYLTRVPNLVPLRGLRDARNVRIQQGRLTNQNIGYTKFHPYKFNGRITGIDTLFLSNGGQILIVGTPTDLYEYSETLDRFAYITPAYIAGTVTVTQDSAVVAGAGTLWATSGNTKAGDYFGAGASNLKFPGHTNLFAYSEQFGNANWVATGLTVTADAATNPFDVKQTADKLVEDGSTGAHRVAQRVPVTGAVARKVSVYVQAAERAWALVGFFGAAAPASATAYVNLSTGALGTVGAGIVVEEVQALAAGWYRVTVSATATGAGNMSFEVGPTTGNGIASYTGDGTSGIHVFGAMLETGAGLPGYYVPNETPWYRIATVDNDTQITLDRPYAEASAGPGAAYTIRKTMTSLADNVLSSETFPEALPSAEDLWIATNNREKPVVWNGVTDFAQYSTVNFRCKWVRRFKNMMIYGNLTLDTGAARPYSIRNSNIGEPLNVTTGSASEFRVHDGVDQLLTALPLGDILVIYGSRSITTAAFVEGLIFAFRTGVSGIGPLAERIVADFGDFHQFVATDAMYKYDGITVTEVNFHIWPELLRVQDPARLALALSIFDEENGDLLWLMPRTTDVGSDDFRPPERAFTEHYTEDVGETTPVPYTVRDLPVTASGFWFRQTTLTWNQLLTTWAEQNYRWNDKFLAASFPLILVGTAEGFVQVLNSGQTADGQTMPSYAWSGRFALNDHEARALINRVYMFTERLPAATYPLDVTVYTANRYSGEATANGPFPFDLTHAGRRFINPRVLARYASLRWGTDGGVWIVDGWEVEVKSAGKGS